MNEFFQNPSLAAIQFEGNSSDSEPEAGEISVQERQNKGKLKKSNIMSIQKYYKASKIMKFTDRSGLEDDGKYFKNKS